MSRKRQMDEAVAKIDLHGLRHEDARKHLIRKIEELWGTGEPIDVVTGNSPRMKEIVRQVLTEYGMGCQQDDVNNGVLRTEAHEGGTNGKGWKLRP